MTAEGASCLGIEPCERAAEAGRNRWGVEIITGGFENAVLPAASFDVVVLSHVAEHLRDPGLALRSAHSALKPGGWLFVEVPNVLAPRVEHVVNFFTFDHLYNFSPRTLERLANVFGFEMKIVDVIFPFPAFRFLAERMAEPQPRRSFVGSIDECAVSECREAVLGSIAGRREFVVNLRSRVDERSPMPGTTRYPSWPLRAGYAALAASRLCGRPQVVMVTLPTARSTNATSSWPSARASTSAKTASPRARCRASPSAKTAS